MKGQRNMVNQMLKTSGLIALVLFMVMPVFSQEVEFRANAKGTVQVGEQFRVTYSVNSQASNFKGPSFEGFRILSGPNQSTNQSYQIINGKVAQSFEITYTYYLQAIEEGTYDIPGASVVVDGKKYLSNPVQITVSKSQAPASGPGKPASQGDQETITKEDVFIRALVDKSNPYQGEQVIITYRIYTKIPISQLNITKLSSFQGFWYKDLLDGSGPLKQSSERINGEEYITADLRKIVLFPQRSGDITIDPLELSCLAQVRVQADRRPRDPFFDSFFDDPFFNRNIKNVEIEISSNSLVIKVKPLPSENRPVDFSGAVGSFSIATEIDRNELKANEPVVLKAVISGKGNIELIDKLDVVFPPDFETYDPKIINKINTTATGLSGSRTFEYLAIPRNAGQFNIKPLTFSYFDLSKNQYVTLTGPEYRIDVAKGDQEQTGISYSGVSQKDIQFIGSDIRHIRTQSISLAKINSHFFGSMAFYLWLLIPFILFIIFLTLYQNFKKRRGDVELVKKRKANKVARKNLKKASEFLDTENSEAFYVEISRALWGYISNKFNIPLSELSIDTVSQRLGKKNVSPDNIEEFTDVLNSCEYARFAPGDKSRKMQDIYDAAMRIITKIENELK